MDGQAHGGRPRGARSAQGVLRPAAGLGGAPGGHEAYRGLQGPVSHRCWPGGGQGGQGALQAYH
eukprot:10922995-Alexandrium_andersonii.AAC.1